MYKHSPPQRFGAQVVPVVPPDATVAAQAVLERLTSPAPAPAEQPDPKEPMPDPILRALTSLDFRNAERKRRRDEWIAARIPSNEVGRKLIEEELGENHELLVRQHAECRARGREQEKIVGDMLGRLAATQQQIDRLDAAFAECRSQLNAAKEERANLGRFARDEELVKADDKIRKCEERVKKAAGPHAEAMQERNFIVLTALPPEQEKLNAIVVELNKLEALLAGASPDSAERLSFGFLR